MNPDELRRRATDLRDRIPPRRAASPPVDTGKLIGTVERSADESIRITWCEYQGKPYVNIRLWKRSGIDGSLWPDSKRGISIRIRELPGMAEAIAAAVDMAAENLSHRPSPASGERPPRRAFNPAALPPSGQGQGRGNHDDFDEFSPGR